jgi:hypothetical protein
MALNGLSRFGLVLLAFGWVLLVFNAVALDLQDDPISALIARRIDLRGVGEMAIVTGLGLALLGALRSGFGSLNRFFRIMEQGMETPKPPASEAEAIENGLIRDRGYVLFADGTVEVETLLGPRRFASLEEAQEFIRV